MTNAPAESDAEIVEDVLRGNVNAFERLMRRYNALVFRTARGVVRNDASAEDCAQRAWISAFDHLTQLGRQDGFAPWIARIAYREAIRSARKAKLRAIRAFGNEVGERGVAYAVTPELEAQRSELRAQLEASIDELPDTLREVFVLCEVQSLSTRETGDILGISEENVRIRRHRARQALSVRITHEIRPEVAFFFDGERCNRMVAVTLRALQARCVVVPK